MRLAVASTLAVLLGTMVLAQTPAPDPTAVAHFEKSVRPLLLEKCVACHGGREPSAGLRLDRPITKAQAGELLRRVNGVPGKDSMPPTGKLSALPLAALDRWVKNGSPFPATTTSTGEWGVGSGGAKKTNIALWSFVPPKRQLAPPIDGATTDIDAFLRAKSEKAGLISAPEADRRTLLRRLSFDLTGLPPAPAQVEAFLSDPRPDAYEKQVARLLASPEYGQKWARHWLDIARYADSNGLDENLAHGNAWRYRDWVVDALNKDLPYDQFLTQQLAGDLLPGGPESAGYLTATGFLTLGPKVLAE